MFFGRVRKHPVVGRVKDALSPITVGMGVANMIPLVGLDMVREEKTVFGVVVEARRPAH